MKKAFEIVIISLFVLLLFAGSVLGEGGGTIRLDDSSFASEISVAINGEAITFDQEPIIIDGRTMVPLRTIFEALGASVEWDNSTQTVTAEKDGTTIQMTIGESTMYVNGEPVILDVAPQLVNNRTLVPTRAVAESFDCSVDWNNNTRTVIISSFTQPLFQLYTAEASDSIAQEGTILLSSEAFYQTAVCSQTSASVSVEINSTISQTDVLCLKFAAHSATKSGKIKITISGTKFSAVYPVNLQDTEYYIPITGYTDLGVLTVSLETEEQLIYVGNMEIVNCGETWGNIKCGIYNIGSWESVVLDESTALSAATSCVTDGKYLYSIAGGGLLMICTLENPAEPKVINTLSGLGNTREIALAKDGNALVITARENGVYFVDISDVYNVSIVSHYDTLELASGVCTDGDYAFVCSRYFGVEILDISDLKHPTWVSTADNNTEEIHCYAAGGYLYVGIWGQKQVAIYNVKDVSQPYLVSTISLDGYGNGCYVENDVLYVATGYHSQNTRSSINQPGYGTGNGLEIYNVSNPEKPIWMSSVKNEGRYYYSGNDTWKVTVSDGYAYLSSTYNGVYVYDVSNPESPIRVSNITVRIEKDSSNYKAVSNVSYVFPYDTDAYAQSPLLGVCCVDGYLYMASPTTGIHVYASDYIKANVKFVNSMLSASQDISEAVDVINGHEAVVYEIREGSIYSLTEYNGLIYAACGSGGIHVLDKNLNLVSSFDIDADVYDIKIHDGILYVAKGNKGIAAYELLSDGTLSFLSDYCNTLYNSKYSAINLTADGKYLLAQAGWTKIETFKVSESAIERIDSINTGTMYYRNLVNGLVAGKYVGISDRSCLRWYYTDDSGELALLSQTKNSVYNEANGCVAYNDLCLAISNKGYVYFNPATATEDEISNLTLHKAEGADLAGKASIADHFLIVTTEYSNEITIVDVADIDSPVLVETINIDGNPGTCYYDNGSIYVPARHGGIIKIKLWQ